MADLDVKHAADVATEVEKLGHCAVAVNLDVTSQHSTNCAIEVALAFFVRIDILVNNAGVFAAPGWE
ncbi:MAG: SDR family NAD(P)-dependent oxidoreductase [Dehalococcoidia bacterium]